MPSTPARLVARCRFAIRSLIRSGRILRASLARAFTVNAPPPFGRSVARSSLVAAIILLLLPAIRAGAAPLPDSTFRQNVILYTGFINGGCEEDTVIGHLDNNLHLQPDGIRWGGGTDTLHTPPCPPDSLGHYHRPRVPFTQFIFPSWDNFRVSVTIDSLNADDRLDLLFFLSGTVTDTAGTHLKSSVLCVFGQNGTDTVTSIRLDTIHGFISTPFFAMIFHTGTELSDPAVRDYSRVPSWVLNKVVQSVPHSTKPPDLPAAVPAEAPAAWHISIYPNPAATSTKVEGTTVPAGDYTIEVLAVNGTTERRQQVHVAESGDLFQVIDLHGLASGYYLLRLFTASPTMGSSPDRTAGGALFGSYPIIVTR